MDNRAIKDAFALLKSQPEWQAAESLANVQKSLLAQADKIGGRQRTPEQTAIDDFDVKADSHLIGVRDVATRDAYILALGYWQRAVSAHFPNMDQELQHRVQYWRGKAEERAYQLKPPLSEIPEHGILNRLDWQLRRLFAKPSPDSAVESAIEPQSQPNGEPPTAFDQRQRDFGGDEAVLTAPITPSPAAPRPAPVLESKGQGGKRGRPQTIPDERKAKAAELKKSGGTNKEAAAVIYQTKRPTDQQVKNVPAILKHYQGKLSQSISSAKPS